MSLKRYSSNAERQAAYRLRKAGTPAGTPKAPPTGKPPVATRAIPASHRNTVTPTFKI